ncbi:ATP-dependent DNA helicase RecG [Azospirillum argentinense]|uniref:ATP-binding protein n=1 Tax=Azospirillum argentinense TaxID=2970906 RepID=UPI0032DE9097
MDKNVVLSRDDGLSLCARVEDDFFDRKAFGIDGRGVQKIAVAFANADGGEFVIGIADDKQEPVVEKRWKGGDSPESFNGVLQALFNLNPTLDFRHEFLTASGMEGLVLRVVVDKSSEVAKRSDGNVYQRIGAQSLPVTDPQAITALAFAKGAVSFESSPLPTVDPEEVVESDQIKRFSSELSPPQEPLAFAINEGLVDRRTFAPNCAGVLLFSDNPQAVFPKRCGVKVVFYDTKLDKPEREHLKKNITLTGPLYELVHKVSDEVSKIMSNISIITAEGMTKVSYPPEAIWEVLVNAIIHRDYSIADDVHVVIYQNRIEVISPGRLPGFVTTKNYLDVRYSRNPKIVRTLARYRIPPNKDLGEGLNTAFQKMKEWRLADPVLLEVGNYVKVVIAHTPLATAEELVLEYLQSNKIIKNKLARELTGIHSENQMKDVFYRLRDQGLIERVPGKNGNAAAWRLVQQQTAEQEAEGSEAPDASH